VDAALALFLAGAGMSYLFAFTLRLHRRVQRHRHGDRHARLQPTPGGLQHGERAVILQIELFAFGNEAPDIP
jgi:hypothetical protein